MSCDLKIPGDFHLTLGMYAGFMFTHVFVYNIRMLVIRKPSGHDIV